MTSGPHMVSRMLIRRWADRDAAGAPRVRSVTVGTAEVYNRTRPQNVMVCDDYVPPQWIKPLERTWESAEADSGELLKAGNPLDIIADDERERAAGGGAVRRLMVVHMVRGFEGTLCAHELADQQGAAADDDPLLAGCRDLRRVGDEHLHPLGALPALRALSGPPGKAQGSCAYAQ